MKHWLGTSCRQEKTRNAKPVNLDVFGPRANMMCHAIIQKASSLLEGAAYRL